MTPVEGVMVTDVVAAQPRTPLPAVILDKQAPGSISTPISSPKAWACSTSERLRLRRRRHRDARTSPRVADPAQTPAAQRARRASSASRKPVSQPDDDVPTSTTPRSASPASCARSSATRRSSPTARCASRCRRTSPSRSACSTRNGRRISPVHQQLAAGAPRRSARVQRLPSRPPTRAESALAWPRGPVRRREHGRRRPPAAASRAPTRRSRPMPARRWRRRVRARAARIDTPRCAAHDIPSVNVRVHRRLDRSGARTPTRTSRYSYADPTSRPPRPTSVGCITVWTATCRIVINYTQHIQPLWDKRPPAASTRHPDGVTVPRRQHLLARRLPQHASTRPTCAQVPPVSSISPLSPPTKSRCSCARIANAVHATTSRKLAWARCRTDCAGPPDANGNPTQVPVGVGPYLNAGSARGARSSAVLESLRSRVGQHACGLPEPGRAALAVGVAGYWGTVFQRSVRSRRPLN